MKRESDIPNFTASVLFLSFQLLWQTFVQPDRLIKLKAAMLVSKPIDRPGRPYRVIYDRRKTNTFEFKSGYLSKQRLVVEFTFMPMALTVETAKEKSNYSQGRVQVRSPLD